MSTRFQAFTLADTDTSSTSALHSAPASKTFKHTHIYTTTCLRNYEMSNGYRPILMSRACCAGSVLNECLPDGHKSIIRPIQGIVMITNCVIELYNNQFLNFPLMNRYNCRLLHYDHRSRADITRFGLFTQE